MALIHQTTLLCQSQLNDSLFY